MITSMLFENMLLFYGNHFTFKDIIEDKAYGAALKYPLENTRLTVAMTDNSSLVMAKAAMDLLQQASTNGSEDSDVSTLYHVIKKEPKT